MASPADINASVACANGCGRTITVARANCAISHGMCVGCNGANLPAYKASIAPKYETRAWEAGEKL